MPVRTVTEEFCDVCYSDDKQKETVATDRLRFAWQGKNYVLLACEKHVGKIRDQLQGLSDIGTVEPGGRGAATRQARGTGAQGGKTLFSQLPDEEKERFRAWADMPNARRIADSRVSEWSAAGKP